VISLSLSLSLLGLRVLLPQALMTEESESARRQEETKAETKGKYDAMREHYRDKYKTDAIRATSGSNV